MKSFRCRSSAQAPRGALVALIVTCGLVLSGCSSGRSGTEGRRRRPDRQVRSRRSRWRRDHDRAADEHAQRIAQLPRHGRVPRRLRCRSDEGVGPVRTPGPRLCPASGFRAGHAVRLLQHQHHPAGPGRGEGGGQIRRAGVVRPVLRAPRHDRDRASRRDRHNALGAVLTRISVRPAAGLGQADDARGDRRFGENRLTYHEGQLPGFNTMAVHDEANDVSMVIWTNLSVTQDVDNAFTVMARLLPHIYNTPADTPPAR